MKGYTGSTGEFYPSVTTVIHILGSKKISRWANYLGFKHMDFDKELLKAAEFGTAAHAFCRQILDPSAPNPDPYECTLEEKAKLKNVILSFIQFQEIHHIKAIVTEYEMVSDELKVGGTCDVYGSFEYKGQHYEDCIIDFKTAKRVQEIMWLQLGAYYLLLKEKGYNPKYGVILRLRPEASLPSIIEEDKLIEYGNAFVTLKHFFDFWSQHENIE